MFGMLARIDHSVIDKGVCIYEDIICADGNIESCNMCIYMYNISISICIYIYIYKRIDVYFSLILCIHMYNMYIYIYRYM